MADRRNKTVRDMGISMGVIVVSVLVLTGLNGGFSFSPGQASGGNTQSADVQGGFATAGRVTGFPVVVPKKIPANWHPSSFSITAPPGTPQAPPTVRGGWLTPAGAYITLVESSGAPAAVLAAELGQRSGETTGSVVAGGATWTVSPGVRQESAWSRTRAPARAQSAGAQSGAAQSAGAQSGGIQSAGAQSGAAQAAATRPGSLTAVTLLITGNASPDDFRTLAAAVAG